MKVPATDSSLRLLSSDSNCITFASVQSSRLTSSNWLTFSVHHRLDAVLGLRQKSLNRADVRALSLLRILRVYRRMNGSVPLRRVIGRRDSERGEKARRLVEVL